MTDRSGNYMHTSNGRKYWPLDPRASEIDIEVIAHHLANKCRYNGACRHMADRTRIFYSVAEHSCYVAHYIVETLKKPEFELEGLLHDGSEAYNGDLIRPLKYDTAFRAPFQRVEELNERVGAERFGLIYPYPKEVKIADEAVTSAEVEQIIFKHPAEEWESGKLHDDSKVAPYEIAMLAPYQAKRLFLDYFHAAWERRQKRLREMEALAQPVMSA